ncbi:MAG TPA: fibro-slime domain-containing protein, partial [Leptolyngbyaceae cyanobacterium M65_K2018_010]|nr:fibro-slime domain-containing protein [Leptolyngbyaceae cyanobacterium M65_K2018_010]
MINPMPEKMTLSATVRSFEANHPDFETEALTYVKDAFGNFERDVAGNLIKVTSVETGIVAPRLVEGKPVYNENRGQNRGQTTSGRLAFEQWFSQTHPAQRQLNFDFGRRDDGVYVFEDRAFFPLNPQGQPLWNKLFTADGEALTQVGRDVLGKIRAVHPNFGQGMSDLEAMKQRYDNWSVRNNTYHFTLEAETTFIYRGDEEFAFFGDDDLWVFIDDKLVMDLGGLHPPLGCQDLAAGRRQSEDRNAAPMPGYLDLRSTNPRNRSFSSNTLRLRLRDDLGISHADEYLELVLTVGQPYTMKLFYAERHTLEADCCFYTTLQFAEAEAKAVVAAPAASPAVSTTKFG